MSVSSAVQEFINDSLVQNNKCLLEQISKLVADSAENIKRSSVEAADEQLREIKKLRHEEPKAFKRKGNEIQYKFNSKLQDTLDEAKSHLEANAVEKAKASLSEGTSMLTERQKLILLADNSEFGWKTVEEYTQHELADDEADGKKIRRAEERAEKALKSATSKKSAKRSSSVSRPSTSHFGQQNFRSYSTFGSLRNQSDRLSLHRSPVFPSRSGNCFACGKFGHGLATGDLSALNLFVPRVLEPKVFQVTDDYWSTTKVSLTFHLLIPRVISLRMFPKIQSRNIETLSLKM